MTDRRTRRHASILTLLFLAAWLGPSRWVLSQEPVATPHIDVAERFDYGAKIAPEFVGTALEGATAVYEWTVPDGMESELADGGKRVLLWAGKAKQGVQKISLSVTYTIQLPQIDPVDPTKLITKPFTLPPYQYAETFVLGAVPPGPIPDNPDPPPPGPAGPLSQLIPDPAKRALLGEFYADMALAVRAGTFANTTHFRNAYREAIRQAQATGALPTGLAAVDKPISDRIAAAIGLAADVPLDAAKNTALGDVFDAVAADFRGTKWPAS